MDLQTGNNKILCSKDKLLTPFGLSNSLNYMAFSGTVEPASDKQTTFGPVVSTWRGGGGVCQWEVKHVGVFRDGGAVGGGWGLGGCSPPHHFKLR